MRERRRSSSVPSSLRTITRATSPRRRSVAFDDDDDDDVTAVISNTSDREIYRGRTPVKSLRLSNAVSGDGVSSLQLNDASSEADTGESGNSHVHTQNYMQVVRKRNS